MGTENFKDIQLVLNHANDRILMRPFVSQGDWDGRSLTVQYTNNGVVEKVPGLAMNLKWRNKTAWNQGYDAFECIDEEQAIFRIDYSNNMMTPGTVEANIEVLLDGKITNLRNFEMLVQGSVLEPKAVISDSSYSALEKALANVNQYDTEIDKLKVYKADKDTLDKEVSRLETTISAVNAGPGGFFNTEADLNAAYPGGSDRFFVVDGYAYYWSNGNWVKGSIYQGIGLANRSVDRYKINFQDYGFTNQFLFSDYVSGEYYDLSGNLIKQGDSSYIPGWGRTKMIPVVPGDVLSRNEKLSSSDGDACFLSYFADEAGTQLIQSLLWYMDDSIVPAGANFATAAIHNRELTEVVITKNEQISFVDSKFALELDNFQKIPYISEQGRLVPTTAVNDVITLDYLKSEIRFNKIATFLMSSMDFNWLWGDGENRDNDLVVTFDEIYNTTWSDYIYLFIKRKFDPSKTSKNMFMFGGPMDFLQGGYRKRYLNEYVLLGVFNIWKPMYSLPGTPVKVITSTADVEKKTISILGDSISTFQGYNPDGNPVFYPHQNLSEVNDTWWGRLIHNYSDELSLNMNNSWSGSTITTTAGDEQSGIFRASNLDSGEHPDLIVVYIGINDFLQDVPLGDYNGRTGTPVITTKFSEAYGVMLNNIVSRYTSAQVYCCTLPTNSYGDFPRVNGNGVPLYEFNDRIRSISESFGCGLIELDRAGVNHLNVNILTVGDGLHPNTQGMALITEKVRKAVLG